ncbi:DUF465 domain-containing protein [Brevundimonas sp. 2R-24]|uniref:DUF465 domain-containing protein n=1 Tax=Peiella sedimenti TaxID=3061083 RepID=A0ABT8SMG0_9CAUL|nr:DUF465 domain-containing protein [Caulobacteraceae bacterium XZ-24]
MAIDARIRELGNRRRQLDAAIHQEETRPMADSLQIRTLKRQKLRLKEQIESLQAQA